MTVEKLTNRINHAPDGVNDTFAYNFRVDLVSDMVVYADGEEYTGDFSMTELGNPLGGDVEFDTPPVGTISTLTLIREVPLTQLKSYPEFSAFPSASHEAALDKLTQIVQQLQESLDRALIAPVDESETDYTLPPYEAGEYWAWDDEAQEIITKTLAGLGTVSVGTDVDDVVELIDDGEGGGAFPSSTLILIDENDLISDIVGDALDDFSDSAHVWGEAQTYGVTEIESVSGVLTWDVEASPVAQVTLDENITSIVIENAEPGGGYELTLIQDGTGSRTVAFPAGWLWPLSTAMEVTATAGSEDILSLSVRGTSASPVIRAMEARNFGTV